MADSVNRKKGVLVLEGNAGESPREFEGQLFGAFPREDASDQGYGEIVFNTSMTGYQEILTDPSYFGQIICMTTPHIGNTGINTPDNESRRIWCAGWIVQDHCDRASSWRAEGELSKRLEAEGVPGLSGVDTRALTLHLRSRGVCRGIILPMEQRERASERLRKLPSFEGRDLIREVSTREPYRWPSVPLKNPKYHVVAMDFGIKWNLLRELEALGCQVTVVPCDVSAQEILKYKPDGVFLSNGPGDPSAAPYAVESVRELLGQIPIFGVCMGHQILALALGARTYKLKFGHRGGNHPVQDQETRRVEISSHNHGYSVEFDSLPDGVRVTHINLNDKTVEGISVPGQRAFSVQYHPEASPGPHDSAHLFQRFVEGMKA